MKEYHIFTNTLLKIDGEHKPEEVEWIADYLRKELGEKRADNLIEVVATSGDENFSLKYEEPPIKFERIRRITGYLVGTTDRWNNAKKAEEHERVKHFWAPILLLRTEKESRFISTLFLFWFIICLTSFESNWLFLHHLNLSPYQIHFSLKKLDFLLKRL